MNDKKIFYISDLHFDHHNIITLDHRPFFTTAEMNAALIKNWNRVVRPCDTVYVLGDMFWCGSERACEILDLLHGEKVLVKGNHDCCNVTALINRFTRIDEYVEIVDNDRKVVLCHYPIPCFKNHFYGWYHLYGHVHGTFEWEMTERFRGEFLAKGYKCQMYNVGCMMPWMDYTPRTLDEIISGDAAWRELKKEVEEKERIR